MPPSAHNMSVAHAERRDSGITHAPTTIRFQVDEFENAVAPHEDDNCIQASSDSVSGFSNETQDSDLPPELLANYEMQNTLGDGATAKVRKAVHILSGVSVAVKVRISRMFVHARVSMPAEDFFFLLSSSSLILFLRYFMNAVFFFKPQSQLTI